jgi:hypothetical protein
MAIPNTYWLNRGAFTNASGTPSVFELVNGTQLSLIGDEDIGDGLEGNFPESIHTNRILEFKGKRYLWHKEFIKEENEGGTGNWGIVHTTNASANTDLSSGLFTVLRNGVLNMVGMAHGGSFRVAFRFDGTTWTNITGLSGGTIRSGKALTFNNKLYWDVYDATFVYDPVDDSLASLGFNGSFNTVCRDYCVLNNELFAAGYNEGSGSNQEARLWKLEDTGWEVAHIFSSSPDINMHFAAEYNTPILFTPDNQNLVLIISGETSVGVAGDQAALIQNPGTGSQVVTDITDPIIPSDFRPGGANAVNGARYILFTDTQNSSVPTSPDFYIWRLAVHNSGNWGFYQYTDTSTELTYLGIGPSFQYVGPHIKQGGQGRISAGANATSTNKVYAAMENPVISSTMGAMDVSFRVYGTDTGLDGRVYLSLNQETPDTQITILSVSGGSASVASNVISNITADGGATLYTFTWAAASDGVTDGVPVTLVMDLTT